MYELYVSHVTNTDDNISSEKQSGRRSFSFPHTDLGLAWTTHIKYIKIFSIHNPNRDFFYTNRTY